MQSFHAVSKRYSKSLFLEALKLNIQDEVLSEVEVLSDAFDASEDLQGFVKDPSLSVGAKISFFTDFLQSRRFSDLMIDFFDVVVTNRREALLKDMFDLYHTFFLEHTRTRRIVLTSSRPLDDDTRNLVSQSIEKLSFMKGFKPLIDYKVDASIVGGFIVESVYLGIRYDDSITGTLGELELSLN